MYELKVFNAKFFCNTSNNLAYHSFYKAGKHIFNINSEEKANPFSELDI